MLKFNKVVLSLGVAGMVFAGSAIGSDQKAEAAYSYINQSEYEKGIFVGWADSGSFEIKTTSGEYMVLRTSNSWYKKNLVPGKSYTYFYYTNQYGQNIITEIQK